MRSTTKDADITVVFALPRVDLLPPEIAAGRRLRSLQRALAALVLAAVGVVGLLHMSATASVREAETSLQTAQAERERLQAETSTYREVAALHARADQADVTLVRAMAEEVRYSRLLDDLSRTVPESVWITSLTFSQNGPPTGSSAIGTVTISGAARSHDDVAAWLEALAAQQGYATPLLQSSANAEFAVQKVVNWTTTAALTSERLSGRYAQGGRS